MNPNVFVSSTYRDLRYIRNDLKRLLENYKFTPIMFDYNGIYYKYDQLLDKSCYDAVVKCDLFILIIGSEFGSEATNEKNISITRKEFETALENDIPLYVFIENYVIDKYSTYIENNMRQDIKYGKITDIRIFEMIGRIYDVKKIWLHKFESFTELEESLKTQWAYMFGDYLRLLRNTDPSNDLQGELNTKLENIQMMLSAISRQVVNKNEYQEISKKIDENITDLSIVKIIKTIIEYIQIQETVYSKEETVRKMITHILNADSNDKTQIYDKFLQKMEQDHILLSYSSLGLISIYDDLIVLSKVDNGIDNLIDTFCNSKYLNQIF